jgi:hypothetical protein
LHIVVVNELYRLQFRSLSYVFRTAKQFGISFMIFGASRKRYRARSVSGAICWNAPLYPRCTYNIRRRVGWDIANSRVSMSPRLCCIACRTSICFASLWISRSPCGTFRQRCCNSKCQTAHEYLQGAGSRGVEHFRLLRQLLQPFLQLLAFGGQPRRQRISVSYETVTELQPHAHTATAPATATAICTHTLP